MFYSAKCTEFSSYEPRLSLFSGQIEDSRTFPWLYIVKSEGCRNCHNYHTYHPHVISSDQDSLCEDENHQLKHHYPFISQTSFNF